MWGGLKATLWAMYISGTEKQENGDWRIVH